MELAHGRDRSNPIPGMQGGDRPLDIDTLACGERDDFAEAGWMPTWGSAGGDVSGRQCGTPARWDPGLPGSKVFAKQRIGQAPSISASKTRPCFPAMATLAPLPGTPPSGTLELLSTHEAPKGAHVMAARLALDDGEGAPPVHPDAGPGHVVVLHQHLYRPPDGLQTLPAPAASSPAPAGASHPRACRETGWGQALWC